MAQGFNSERIADMLDLPVSVIKRYFISTYFKVKGRDTCAQCGKKFKIKKNKQRNIQETTRVFCNLCKKKASDCDVIEFYSSIDTCPSDMEEIKVNVDVQLKKKEK